MREMGDGGAAASGWLLWQRGDSVSISNAWSNWNWDFKFAGHFVHDNYTLLCSVLMNLVERSVPSRVGNAIPWPRSSSDRL